MAQSFTDIILPGWEVVRKLGEGSFGGVYEIQRTLPDGTVERAALKKLTVPKDPGEIAELYDQSYDSASITAHFKEQMQDLVREYAFMQKLGENPNVVHCQDLRTVQHEDGIGWDIYIRMELLQPLKKWLSDRYDERQVIRLGLNLCGALNGCHQKNIIHRDIKPENVLVTEDGRFKLGDFGIAKISEKTATGTLTGTYSYMAPEIYHHQHYGTGADIYSLGLVMYWMMNERKLPFLPLSKKIPSGIQRQEAQDRRLSGEKIPAPINGSLELTEIVLKACAFDPKERYHSVQELAEDLKWHYQNLRSGTVRKPKPANQPRTDGWEEPTIGTEKTYEPPMQEEPPEEERGHWKPLVIAGIAVLAIAVVGLGISIPARTQREKPESAEIVYTPQIPTVETTPAITASVPETTLPPETEPVKIHIMAAAADLTSMDWDKGAEQPFWGQTKYLRSDVKSVTFRGTLDGAPDDAWDVSEEKDRSILAWMESGNLIMAADGKIASNPNASCLFAYFENANAIDFGDCFDTSMVTDMQFMFSDCSSLSELDVSGFDTSMVTDMSAMFQGCNSLTYLDVSGFDTSMVTNMGCMFCGCSSLTELDVSGFDTSRVAGMNLMFIDCSSLTELDVSGFDTSEVTGMVEMFFGCSNLTELDVSGFDTSKVTDMGMMFYNCSSLRELDVSGFDTAEVTNMGSMFSGCSSLNSIQCIDSRILDEYNKR